MKRTGLVRHFADGVESIDGVLRSLHNFAPESAQRLEMEFTSELDTLFFRMASRLSAATDDVLEEKRLNQEDEDSSGTVHLLMSLKDRADSLVGSDK